MTKTSEEQLEIIDLLDHTFSINTVTLYKQYFDDNYILKTRNKKEHKNALLSINQQCKNKPIILLSILLISYSMICGIINL